jgi:release factor glutamine methyltransferase
MPDNKFESVIQYFHQKLDVLYNENEVESFFWVLSENELDKKHLDYMMDPNIRMSESQLLTFIQFSRRLAKFEPVQYMVGKTDFMGFTISVNSSVLIPRPETEELVQWVLKSILDGDTDIIDIGTGSGCIPIAIKSNLPNSRVIGVDIMSNALEVAQQNGELNEVDVEWQLNDALNMPTQNEKFDVIISNPPYVLNKEKLQMSSNVLDYEPHTALFVEDDDPLLFYKSISDWAIKSLKNNGWLFFEINQKYGQETIEILTRIGFRNIELRNDIYDVPRMIRATK